MAAGTDRQAEPASTPHTVLGESRRDGIPRGCLAYEIGSSLKIPCARGKSLTKVLGRSGGGHCPPAFPLFFYLFLVYYRENIPDIQRKPEGRSLLVSAVVRCNGTKQEREAMA